MIMVEDSMAGDRVETEDAVEEEAVVEAVAMINNKV